MPPVRYPKHAATLAWASKQLGEHEQPPGSNTGPFVQLCQHATWLAGTGWAWCRAFSLKAHQEGGFILPDGSAGAWDALERARKRGDALTPQQYQLVIPGDEVIWAFGAGHCSIYAGIIARAGTVYVQSIDGNVQDQVERCERPLSQVKGFIHWPEQPLAPAGVGVGVKVPKRQVVGSISGNRQLVTRKGRVIPLPARKPPATLGVVRAIPHDALLKPPAKTKAAAKSPALGGGKAKPAVKSPSAKTPAKQTARRSTRTRAE